MRLIPIIMIAFLATGCISPLSQEPVTLLATTTSMNHNGAGSVEAVPDQNVLKPTNCTIFRDGALHNEDSCTVRDGDAWYIESPWHVTAGFAGSGYPLDDRRRWSEKTIEAYDAEGRLVGLWDGGNDYHPEHMRAIE